jgi:hypothetical protein
MRWRISSGSAFACSRRLGDIGMQLGEIAKVSQHGANTNVMLHARDAQKLALAKREVEEMLERAASTIKYRVILALSRRKQGFESPRERQ